MSDWQPIESAPKDGTHIIAGTTFPGLPHKGRVFFDWFFESGAWGNEDDEAGEILFRGEVLTHWMPLPEPPAARNEGAQ